MDMLNEVASWSSIASLVISVVTIILVGSLRAKVIEFRRKARIRELISDIRSIPDDAVPLSTASISKLKSLSRNLPNGWLCLFSSKAKAAWDTQQAIKNNDLPSVKEGMEDWLSHSEDL